MAEDSQAVVNAPERPEKVNRAVRDLINVLLRKTGNKRYLYDFEKILSRLELSKLDEQTLYFLIQDLAD